MGGGGTGGSSAGKTRLSSSDPIFNSFSSPGARRRPSASSEMEGGAEAERRVAYPGPGRPATGAGASSGPFASVLGGRRGERPPARHAEMLAETCGTCSGASLAVSLEETRAVHARAGDLCLGCAPRFPPRRRAPACVTQTLLTTFSGLAPFPLLMPFLRFFILTIPPRTTSPPHFPYATPLPAPSLPPSLPPSH